MIILTHQKERIDQILLSSEIIDILPNKEKLIATTQANSQIHLAGNSTQKQ
jgi:hypothetical protein